MEEQRGNEKDYFVVFTNDHRDTLLGYKVKAKDTFDVQIYLNFEDHPIEIEESEIKGLYTVSYEGSTHKGTFQRTKASPGEQVVQLQYSGIWLPPYE